MHILIIALYANCSPYWLCYLFVLFLLSVMQEKQFTIIMLSQLNPSYGMCRNAVMDMSPTLRMTQFHTCATYFIMFLLSAMQEKLTINNCYALAIKTSAKVHVGMLSWTRVQYWEWYPSPYTHIIVMYWSERCTEMNSCTYIFS